MTGISLAAARHLWRHPEPDDRCWADVPVGAYAVATGQGHAGQFSVCGETQATDLGLCRAHLLEIFALVSPPPDDDA